MEINAAPGIRMHEHPSFGEKRDVGESILKLQYNGKPSNIPVISITGTNGKTTTTRLISYILKLMGHNVGMTSTEGIYINEKCIDRGDDTGYYSAKTVLLNKDVDVAVLETARGGLIKRGLAYDLADVAVITNITEDHLGLDEVDSMERLAFVKSLVAEAVKEKGYVVINADDEWSLKILDRIKAEKIFFSKTKQNPYIQQSIKNGKTALYVNNNSICATNNNKEYKILEIDKMPISLNGMLEFNIENAMAACGALIGVGVDYCMISKGLSKFKPNKDCNAGRFNIYDVNGVNVILDYGHNIEGYRAVLDSLSKMDSNRLIGVIGVPGDREDKMIIKIGSLCSNIMNSIFIKEDLDRRGRKSGEVAELLQQGIDSSGNNVNSRIILNEVEALREAINTSKSGDTVIVFYENLDPLVDVIKEYTSEEESLNLANL